MKNLREVKDDLLKEWIEFREVPEQNKKYVQKQLDQLDKNFMDTYITGMKSIIEMDLRM